MTPFEMVAGERRTMADLVEGLREDQLCKPSLVPTWTVRDVAAHLTLAFETSMARFLLTALLARSFEKAADKLTFAMAKRPVKEIAESLRRNADSRFSPPGTGPEAPLAELLVHGLDLRWPLAILREIPPDRARPALDFLAKTPARGFVRSAWRKGLRFEAMDLDWAHGAGPALRGRAEALMLALTGRRQALEALQGDGVEVLRQRFGP
jgi:uncharacterized protein (TIGR03083 family)